METIKKAKIKKRIYCNWTNKMQFKLLRLLISEYNKIDTNPAFPSNEHFEILLGIVIAPFCLTAEMNDRRLIEERSSIAEYVHSRT